MAGEAMILSAIDNLDRWLVMKADLRDGGGDNRNLVFEEAEIWEGNKEMFYSLLAITMDPFDTENLLLEKADLWEAMHDMEKLQSLVSDVAEYALFPHDRKIYEDRWKDNKGKLSKEKLYRRVADIKENLNQFINDVATPQQMELHGRIWKEVEEVKNELRIIMDLLKSEDLHYFISDVVEMAQYAEFFIRVMDSDPFILYLHIYNCIWVKSDAYDARKRMDGHPLGELLIKLESIKNWLKETKEGMLEFRVERLESSQINVGEELVVVGLEKNVESLLDGIGNMKCITIWGMSGIGKTTLARQLYNHPTVVDLYECRAWVCLSSPKLSRKEKLIKLIRQVVDCNKGDDDDDIMLMEKMDNRSLRQMLHQQLKGKQHFIVFDDFSEDTFLKYVFQALPKEASRSTLVFTTRKEELIRRYKSYYSDHKMKLLDGDKSWQLLLKTTLLGSSDDDEFPKKKGREMLMRTCGGLPLAIKELGRHWVEKRRSGSEWEQILESSINLDLIETSAALESTYLNLDSTTKSCFLRLAFFKEGTIIRKNKILQIFTAEGMEEEDCDVGLSNLATQSIIKFKNMMCHLNAIFQRLSVRKAEDEIGFEVRRKDGNNRASHEPRQCRHRVVYCSREKFDYRSGQDEHHLVSLFFHGGSHFNWAVIHHFEQLKILDMEDFGLKILPETVGELSELRYLGLRNNYINELPHSLGHLKRLEVLDMALNFMVQVPDIIWEMDSLRHIYMSDIICRKPLKIDALKHLQTLTYISVDNLTCLNLMTSLRKLGIEDIDENSDVSKLFASLAELENLECLILRGFRFRRMPSLDKLRLLEKLTTLKLNGRLTRLPSSNNFPPNIYRLSLINSCLDEDPMPILGKLEKVYSLKLKNAYTGRKMVIVSRYFRLYRLVIKELWHLRNLQVEGHTLRNLHELEIISCPYLEISSEELIRPNKKLSLLKIVTTKKIATKIRKLYCISTIDKVDITP